MARASRRIRPKKLTCKLSFCLFLLLIVSLNHGGNKAVNGWTIDRRTCLQLLQTLQVMDLPTSPSSFATAEVPTPEAEITDRVFMDIRISRNDGSFYVRDDLPDTFENRVIQIRLAIGLFGNEAPNHVQKFLGYVVPPNDDDIDNPYPSYGRSTFVALDQETGLLQGGNIPSLRVKDIGGSTAITYGSRVLPANLWIEKKQTTTQKLSHSSKGLLTHKTLDVTPSFGITTRASPSLDATHTVFGKVLYDDSTIQWFRDLQDLPTYSMDRPTSYDDFNSGGVATSVFNAQRQFFRGAAKSLGDTRVDKVYEGKLMRRMEVTQVGRL